MRARSVLLDNTKFVLVFLVVFGHLCEPVIERDGVLWAIYAVIYSVHMPLFVFISGALSSGERKEGWLRKLVETIAAPLVVFTLIYELLELVLYGRPSFYTRALKPYWILWFLYSLFLWRLALPFVGHRRLAVPVAIAVAIAMSYFWGTGYFLGVSRTLVFFPFFLLGFQFRSVVLNGLGDGARRHVVVTVGLIFAFVAASALVLFLLRDAPVQWLLGSLSFPRLGVAGPGAAGMRLAIYGLSTVAMLSLLSLLPVGRTPLTQLGQRSLYVFLLHGIFVKVYYKADLANQLSDLGTSIALLVMLLLAVLISLILSTRVVEEVTARLVIAPAARVLLRLAPRKGAAPR